MHRLECAERESKSGSRSKSESKSKKIKYDKFNVETRIKENE